MCLSLRALANDLEPLWRFGTDPIVGIPIDLRLGGGSWPATNAVAATIRTGPGAHHVAIGENAVWVTNYQENTVSRIDPSTMQ